MIGIIGWLAGAFTEKTLPGRVESSGPKLVDQPTDVVHEVTKDYIEESVGTLKAASRTEISARVLATIDEIRVSAGDMVDTGDVLVRLDDKEMQTRVQQAEQTLLAATASRAQAATEFSRAEQLLQKKVTTQAAFDAAKAQLEVTQADESRAREALDEARIVLSYATITAPRPGRVIDRLAEPGDTARPGQPLLVIYDAASLRLEAAVPEQLAIRLKVGDRLDVRVDALDRNAAAVIDQIVPQADAPSRSFLVKATLPRSDDLYEGMFGRLLIPAGQRRHLCLATAAIQEVGQLEFVTVVRDDNTLERRLIRTGRIGMPGRVEVLSGLSPGERVILADTSSSVPEPEKEATP
ncbi:MAG: efflux RND transporter periplasmic adaptor subunit [Fuerstiella sp.]